MILFLFFIVRVCLLPLNTVGFFFLLLLRVMSQQHVGYRQLRCPCAAWCERLFLCSVPEPVDVTLSSLLLSLWFFRYDEWVKAEKIVRPANKNVPKVKHRKKIKVRRRRSVTFPLSLSHTGSC